MVAIDDDASALYAEHGLVIDLSREPAFFAWESEVWARSVRSGRTHLAISEPAEPIAFAALSEVDGAAHLAQLSVRRAWMGRGVGRALLERALEHCRPSGVVWITTYAHLPFNAPFYERHGFVRVEDESAGPELRAILARERCALPAPEQRIAMKHAL